MVKKLIILAGVLGVAAVIAKKVRSANEERALWHEATTAPDLR
ncbi:DLW-39 family protein [Planosporangium mesophilum]|jgi:Tfp pilus assembly protein PilV|nr:DLW-39 family protein [Planosporangium mesophilum]